VGVDGAKPDTAVSFKTELHELKQRLQCEKYSRKYCYVDPMSRERDVIRTVSLRYGLVTGLVIVACDLYDTDSF
jgi:hypothetical protein